MRVLVDQNLPHRLVITLAGWTWVTRAEHASDRGWSSAADREIWAALSAEASLIITKDKDFGALSAALGFPPKVVLLRFGNCSVETLLRGMDGASARIEAFAADSVKGLLLVDPPP